MYTNVTQVPLSLAVWLATDKYDHNDDPNTISATALIKPIKQIILGMRVPAEETNDISNLVASRIGTAIHDSIEEAWTTNFEKAMSSMNYPKRVIHRIAVNPTKEELKSSPDCIPVYMEIRSEKEIEGITISGKFDFVGEGRVEDFKSTSTYTYVMKTNDDKYILQGSIYRWLNQDIITKDHMAIQFIFTDWKAIQAKTDPKKYPKSKTLEYVLPLKSIPETEQYIRDKVIQIKSLTGADESQLPECTAEDLWRKSAVWKYYKNPAKRSRSTKNYDTDSEAFTRLADDGHVGAVVKVEGEVVACRYCNALNICKQKDTYIMDGTLKL